jgi:cell division protease FtsH
VDEEVRRILEECGQVAAETLSANRDKLEALTRALLDRETLDEADAYEIAGIERRRAIGSDPQAPAALPSA